MKEHQPGPKYWQQKFAPYFASWVCSIVFTWFLLLGLLLINNRKVYNNLVKTGSPGDISQTFQLVKDWQSVPFVELQTINTSDGGCPNGFEEAFYKDWKGTELGCWNADGDTCGGKNCRIGEYYGFVETKFDFDAEARYNETVPTPAHHYLGVWSPEDADKLRSSQCDEIWNIGPIRQSRINGNAVCGKRSGEPFSTVTRPLFETGQCPEGTEPCSEVTSPDNTVCYPQDLLNTACPITQIFVAADDLNDTIKNDTSYTILPFNEGDPSQKYLVYSKTKTDNLPLTTTTIDSRPCLTPSQAELPKHAYYPTELDRGEYCGSNTDPRYVSSGTSDLINQMEFQRESGVLTIISNQPYIERSVELGPRNAQKLSFWTRPTIPWKLECEITGGRQTVIDNLENLNYQINGYDNVLFNSEISTIKTCSIILLITEGLVLISMCAWAAEGPPSGVILTTCCANICRLCLFVPILIQAIRIVSQLDEIEFSVKASFDLINGCSDEFTEIDIEQNNEEFSYLESKTTRMSRLAIVVLMVYLMAICCFTCYLCATFGHSFETDAENEKQGDTYTTFVAEADKARNMNIDYVDEQEKWDKNPSKPDATSFTPTSYSVNQDRDPNEKNMENLAYASIVVDEPNAYGQTRN